MTAFSARRAVPQVLAAGDKVRRVIASLFPVRPERRPGSLPALPPARKVIVIKPDPSRYGFVSRKALPASDGHAPWDTAVLPVLTDAMIAAIEAGTYRTQRGGA